MVDDTFSGVGITLMSQSVLFSGRQPVTRIVPDGQMHILEEKKKRIKDKDKKRRFFFLNS